ncbi:MAG: hypothetical protein H6621_10245 [Halobacteriovoraceae bacterium]|nr:hypothetical protein [Halobacteriovoraceae bacterium]MCB9095436.1 hypothetical protein [Halobacteriovoraceae bacterium]
MKVIDKFEKKFNKLYYKLVELLIKLFNLILPQPVKNFLTKIYHKIVQTINAINNSIHLIFDKILALIDGSVNLVKKINGPIQEKRKEYKKFKRYVKTHPMREVLENIFAPIIKVFKFLNDQTKKLQSHHIVGIVFLLCIGVIAFIQIYKSTYNIVETEHQRNTRDIASDNYSAKRKAFPYYYGHDKVTSQVTHVKMPAFFEDIDQYRNLEVDFTITFTNRTAKRFYDDYDYLFVDQLQLTLEPILPSFPLTPEGKEIIRGKITDELNAVFINEGIDGRVKEVNIIYMLAN